MATINSWAGSLDDATSYPIKLSCYDTRGLCSGFQLRRHKFESEANAGSHEARLDWIKHVGPLNQFGVCNPVNGHLVAMVLPLCKPERMRLLGYVYEFATLYDDILELEDCETEYSDSATSRDLKMGQHGSTSGRRQIQTMCMKRLAATDEACTKRVIRVWQDTVSTIRQDKNKPFGSIEEYIDFRLVDGGGAFVEATSLFGMGMTLTADEDIQLESIRRSLYAAICLANDFFSFDREWAEFLASGHSQSLRNCVWLFMQWHNIDIIAAKQLAKETTRKYEAEFLQECEEYRKTKEVSKKIDVYMRALGYHISGNLVWSLNCPRYHPEFKYDANAGLEDKISASSLPQTLDIDYHVRNVYPATVEPDEHIDSLAPHHDQSRMSLPGSSMTMSSPGTLPDKKNDAASIQASSYFMLSTNKSALSVSDRHIAFPNSVYLDHRHVQAPYQYITSLPSKGVREALLDALNIWLSVQEGTISRIKDLGSRLHSASLMLDDIEDASPLRRGNPAAHTVFGIAQTINSGCFEILEAVDGASHLGNKSAVAIMLQGLRELHVGQSWDLHWTRNGVCPSEAEYFEMVSKKTGGLFRLLAKLMLASKLQKAHNSLEQEIDELVGLLGVQFQVRDDYQNLVSAESTSQKGFCEDLDEGKFSFPLIHALSVGSESILLRELLQQRRNTGKLSHEQKKLMLSELEKTKSMEYTRRTLMKLQAQVSQVVKRIEEVTGSENRIMSTLLRRLEV